MHRPTTWDDLLHPGDAASFFDRDPLPRFDPTAREFRWENAWWLAELCRLIYRRDVEEEPVARLPARAEFLAKAGLRQVRFFSGSTEGTSGFLVQSTAPPHFSALVFRGTEQDTRDFMNDLDFATVPFAAGAGAVHRGFESALEAVWPDVAAALDNIEGPVFYAGHSLGAAVATLAAARRPPAALYTFGSPLVGDTTFVQSLSRITTFRVVNGKDVVAMVPPESLGFRHVGALHQLRAPTPFGALVNPVKWLQRLKRPPKRLADHAPINYVDGLGA